MGYVAAISPCIGCHRTFSYNPVKVPSIRISGKRQPVCADCVVRVNPMRIKNGLQPIVPERDAYDACDECEIE